MNTPNSDLASTNHYFISLSAIDRKQLMSQTLDAYQLETEFIHFTDTPNLDFIAYCYCEHQCLILINSPVFPDEQVKTLIQRYSHWFNRVHGKRGSLFKADYSITQLNGHQALLDAFHFIHTYPVTEGLTQQPNQHPYSSIHHYEGHHTHSWLSCHLVAPLISQRQRTFLSKLNAFLQQPRHYQSNDLKMGSHFSTEGHAHYGQLNALSESNAPTHPQTAQSLTSSQLRLTPLEMIHAVTEFVCQRYEFKPVQLTTRRRHRMIPEIKGLICHLCLEQKLADRNTLLTALQMDDFDLERGLRIVETIADSQLNDHQLQLNPILKTLENQTIEEKANQTTEEAAYSSNVHPMTIDESPSTSHSQDNETQEDASQPTRNVL